MKRPLRHLTISLGRIWQQMEKVCHFLPKGSKSPTEFKEDALGSLRLGNGI